MTEKLAPAKKKCLKKIILIHKPNLQIVNVILFLTYQSLQVVGCEEKTQKIKTSVTAVPNSQLERTAMPQGRSAFYFSLIVSKVMSGQAAKVMLCSAISNASPCQSENLTLDIILCKSLKYGLICGKEMVSVQRRFEQTKAIQTVERYERERRKNATIDKKKRQKTN